VKCSGFAFVTFESEDTVDKVVDVHYHDINNKTVCNCNHSSVTCAALGREGAYSVKQGGD